MKYGVGNTCPGLRQTQKCGGIKSVSGIHTPPSYNLISIDNTDIVIVILVKILFKMFGYII